MTLIDWSDKAQVREYMSAYYLTHDGKDRDRMSTKGAARMAKTCRRCGVKKLRCEFTVRKEGARIGHLAAYCKECANARQKGAYQAAILNDPSWYRQHGWPSKLRRLYGITVADYEQMLKAQGGRCAVCGTDQPLSGNRDYKRTARVVFDVDHDHATGRVRGLLCTRCNRLVGLANDSAETARQLVKYLSQEN